MSAAEGNGVPAQGFPAGALPADVIRSRGILLDTLHALGEHRDALTVVGAHAVFERTKTLTVEQDMDSTRDADIGVFPELLAHSPLVESVMANIGLELASPSRPGVWGLTSERGLDLHSRLTVDLLAPDALAGGRGSRSAETGTHGKHIVSRTRGTELTLVDRGVLRLESFGLGVPVDAFVAGTAALIAAKCWKLSDRLDTVELNRNPQRLRPKDAGDLWRLLAVSDPEVIAERIAGARSHARIGPAVTVAAELITRLSGAPTVIQLAILHFGGRFPDERVENVARHWSERFRLSSAWRRR